MSLYNTLFGFNSACIFFMPMLGRKQEDYPRFRDCFITEDNNIGIYTRVGGNNRGCGFGDEELYTDKYFIRTYDDDFDNTYATYEFRVPEKWQPDFDKLMDDRMREWKKPPEIVWLDCIPKKFGGCGGKGTMKCIVSKYNGHKHGTCTVCGARFME